MDSSKKNYLPSPEEHANPISKLFFVWVLPFLKNGYKNDLQNKDLYNCSSPDLSGGLGNQMERNWDEEVQRAKKHNERPSLSRTIRKTFIKSYSVSGVLLLIQCTVLRMIHPIVLAAYIKYYDPVSMGDSKTPELGWDLGWGVVIIAFLNAVITHNTSLGTQRIGMRCRIATCSLIYRKLLKLNRSSLGQVPAGKLVNLLSNDVQRFDVCSLFLHYIWIMPIQTCIAFYVMYRSVGWAAVSGMGALILQAVLLQGYLSKLQGIYRGQIAQRTDDRVKLMNEITGGIQVIKMYAWEKPFEKVVQLARKHEINVVAKTSCIRAFSIALMVFTERATLYLTLITYVLMGNRLTGDIVFSMAQLFNTVQLYMAIFYPLSVSTLAESRTSIKRIEEFLTMEEAESEPVRSDQINESDNKGRVELVKACASWTPTVDTLTNLNVDIKPGSMVCVVGPVGSGKSSLLQVLLKELPLTSGSLRIAGNVAYASQEPWLFVSTVRNNILFGLPYLKDRYEDVIKVCALERDFELFPHGDKTLVGERGTSLSGGQRARVNLARAVYRAADVYLLDDPLSAVDTHVGKHLFEKCFLEYLKDKTRILVTHQLQFLKQADLIVVLNNGKIDKVGKFSEISQNELNTISQEPNEEFEKQQEYMSTQRFLSVVSATSTVPGEKDKMEAQETEEQMEKGAIPMSTYLKYYRAGGSLATLLFLLVLFLIAQAASNASDIWVTYWTNMEERRYKRAQELNATFTNFNQSHFYSILNLTNPLEENSTATEFVIHPSTLMPDFLNTSTSPNMEDESIWSQETYIEIYSWLIACCIILTTARSLLFFKICMNASKRLHSKMSSNVLQATMRFFNTNPSGRILNRFSKDIGVIDEALPRYAMEAFQIFLVMSGTFVMVFVVTPWMIAPALVLGMLFYFFKIIYLASAQDVKRLEGINRAPVFSHVSASLHGLSTIRSSHAQQIVTEEFDSLQDQHTSAWFLFLATSEAFGFYFDVTSTVFFALVTLQFVIFDDGTTPSGTVGLVTSQSLILTEMLQYGVRQALEVASNMTSVERVLQYTKLDKDGSGPAPDKKPNRDWPKQGRLLFKNVYLRYGPEELPVLRNLNIEIKAGEKIGIVGRTGAGKTSLIAALFRLAEIEGVIKIDDVDTAHIGLYDLRSNISIIPQEPVLFSNTLKYNLDPFERCDDNTLWKALENVELKDAVDSLDQKVHEGGANFSAGQRQLLCLARAIVRNNRVLVMDEATANVDPTTDALIQATIRRNFKDCTVLTIAHRLNTIMDSDRVLVMDAGQAMEFAHAHELLQKPDGYFTKMLRETGTVLEAKLRKVAKDDYDAKFPASKPPENGDDVEEQKEMDGF